MKLFIYTRTFRKKEDYRLLAAPESDYIQDNILIEFVNFSRNVINIDNPLNGNIKIIRWSAFKLNNYILFGVGCNNSELSIFSKDEADRPVRGFFGVIARLPEEKNYLPYDIDFFKYVYKSLIEPHWDEKNFILGDINCPKEINNFNLLSSSNKVYLNTIANKTHLFRYNNELEEYLASCLNYSVCNIVTGINVEEHAIEAGFMNALSFDTIEEKIVDNSKKREQLTSHNKINVTEEKTIHNNNTPSSSFKYSIKRTFVQVKDTLNSLSSPKSQRHTKGRDINLDIDDSNCKITEVKVSNETIPVIKDTEDEDIEFLRQAYQENKQNKNTHEDTINESSTINTENGMLSGKNNVTENQEQNRIDSFNMGLMEQNINTKNNSFNEEVLFDELKEIKLEKPISEKYKALLYELKSSISSIDNYNISSKQYIEIEGLVKELITKIKS
jgi:hypothetical protein